jgi:pimeloyl-ACP methyl ester carboxylesterase
MTTEPPSFRNTRTHQIVVGAMTIAYREAGQPSDAPMVLLHGMGEGAGSWEPVMAELAELGHRVIALDARGHGDSDRPGDYSYDVLRDDVLEVLNALRIERCVLIGHSMGATTAGLLAVAAPHRVGALVLEDAVPPRPGSLDRPPLPRPDEDLPFDWPLVNALRAQLTDPDPAWWEQALRISVPTLVIAGGPPSHIPQTDLHEFASALVDGQLVEIPVGHMVHVQAPGAFVAAVRDFLAGRSGVR